VWVDDVDVCRPREARASTEQALARTALLAAAACALVDAVVFMVETPQLPGTLRIGVLAVIVCVDAALASPARFSGWVTVAHAVAAVGLAVVLRTTPAADMDLIGGAVAAFRAGAWLRGRSSVGALVALASGAVFSQMVADPGNVLAACTELMKDAWIPWLVGYYTATRGAFISALRHDHGNELRDATAQVEKTVDQVRTSIARDLHDVISHHVSAIGIHAGAVRIKLVATPGFADREIIDSLTAVGMSTHSAMAELRRMLDILHGSSDSANQPGLGNLGELFDGVRRAGLDVRFTARGTPRGLRGVIDAALYRILQEMLTNALRYGDGVAVDVELEFGETVAVLTARNTISTWTEPRHYLSTGRGLAGIQSRAGQFGGTVSYGLDAGTRIWETRVSLSYGAPISGVRA
jgi:signal transduction histidine kinase